MTVAYLKIWILVTVVPTHHNYNNHNIQLLTVTNVTRMLLIKLLKPWIHLENISFSDLLFIMYLSVEP